MRWRRRVPTLFFLAAALLLAGGGVAVVCSAPEVADALWLAATVLGLAVSGWTTVRALVRRRASVDVVAVLALAGSWWVGELFAGAVVAVMLASGGLLEARAAGRAERDLRLLVERSPRTARRRGATTVEVVPVEQVRRGDVLTVGSGEVVPTDGRLLGPATLDESTLTGEPMPVDRPAGDDVRSGVVNTGRPLDLVATAEAADSTYAHVVRLVEQAQAASAPLVRTADRFAAWFVPLTLIVAGAAWWFGGGPLRAVAVLVVATPCPLLLAAPVAVMSGLSRAARLGVVVKGGAALEALAAGEVLLFDKTGTLTHGRPRVTSVVLPPDVVVDAASAEVVRLAASLDQVSPHPLASAVVAAAHERGLDLTLPTDVREVHGSGLVGRVDGRDVRLGTARWAVGPHEPAWVVRARRRADLDGCLTVFASVDGRPAAIFLLEDPVRADAPRMVSALREVGIRRAVLVSGDRRDAAETVGRVVGVDEVLAEHDPAAKLAVVTAESARARTVMVGDGVNDAPALAAAGVGVALAARGATASSEAADVVLTVDRLDRLADAILVARRSRSVALQAVVVGMGLSVAAMLAAAAGWLPPAAGAVLQEGIDVLAIGIALRALVPVRLHSVPIPADDVATAQRLRPGHEVARSAVESIRGVADALDRHDPDLGPVVALVDRLDRDLLAHERADEAELMPVVARALGAPAARGLRRTHAEIEQQVGRLRRLVEGLTEAGPGREPPDVRPEDVTELRRVLYGLYAVCRLHDAQEEEGAYALLPHQAGTPTAPPTRARRR